MPRNGWSDKDERMYEHIKQGEQERGRSEGLAEEIAARTVNKQRREEGRTPEERTQGTGNPKLPYEQRTKDELANLARERHIDNSDEMSKTQLIIALRNKDR
jgi:hypothetical protein